MIQIEPFEQLVEYVLLDLLSIANSNYYYIYAIPWTFSIMSTAALFREWFVYCSGNAESSHWSIIV